MQKKVNLQEVQWLNTIELLERIGEESTTFYRSLLDREDPHRSNATYGLYDSIDHRVDVNEMGFILYFIAAEHFKFVEDGRKPGLKPPPIAPIRKWIIDKRLNLPKGVEYAIAKSIGKNGIPAKGYFKQTQEKAIQMTPALIRSIEKDYAEYIRSKTKNMVSNKNNI